MAACIEIDKAVKILSTQKGFAWIDGGVLKVGVVPFQEQHYLDFSSEQLRDSVDAPSAADLAAVPSVVMRPRERLLKHGGKYLFDIQGRIVECNSLKDMLKKGLLALEQKDPSLLTGLSQRRARTRRAVAQKPSELFDDPKLTKYAEPLKPGWFYGTNNNRQTTKDWLRTACEMAGLQWGKDFDVSI